MPNPIDSMLANVGNIQGVGSSKSDAKAKSKSDKELAKLQGKIQSQLAEQQSQYAQQLEAQREAAALQLQQQQQQYNQPFQAAELTGVYNGQNTLAAQQQALNFNISSGQLNLQREMQARAANLADLSQQQSNAIAQGQLDLAKQIETKKVELQAQQQQAQIQLQQSDQSGYLQNGQLTEAARAARANEAVQQGQLGVQQGQLGLNQTTVMGVDAYGNLTEAGRAARANEAFQQQQLSLQDKIQSGQLTLAQAEAMGYDASGNATLAARNAQFEQGLQSAAQAGVMANGQLTDASQQWRSQQGLQAAQLAAQLSQNPADYFQQAAYLRNGNVQDALGFLNNPAAQGSSMGFRGQATSALPQTASIQGFQQGLTQAQQQMPTYAQGQAQLAALPNPQQNVAGIEGAPSGAPSPSIGAAQAAQAGQPAAFGSQMNRPVPTGPQGGSMAAGGFMGGQPDPAQQRLNAFQPIFQQGMQKLAPGTLEAMSPTEKGLFSSAAKASGLDPASLEQQYKRSRLQTDVSALAA